MKFNSKASINDGFVLNLTCLKRQTHEIQFVKKIKFIRKQCVFESSAFITITFYRY